MSVAVGVSATELHVPTACGILYFWCLDTSYWIYRFNGAYSNDIVHGEFTMWECPL